MKTARRFEPMPWAERLLVAQTSLVVIAATAAIGGMAEWAPLAIGTSVAMVIVPLLLYLHSQRSLHWKAFLPATLFTIYIGISLWNPSHVPVDGSWLPRTGWIPWLPATVDRACTVNNAWPWICSLVQGGALAVTLRSRRAVRALAIMLAAATAVFALVGAIGWFFRSDQAARL